MPDNDIYSNAPVRKVQPVNEPDDDNEEKESPFEEQPAKGGGNIVTQGIHTVSSKIKGGFAELAGSMFGLKPAVAAASSGVGKVAAVLHVSKAVTAMTLATTLSVGTGLGAATIVGNNRSELLVRQESYYDNCAEQLAAARGKAVNAATTSMSEDQEEMAKKLWALGKALGFTDYQCAGMLGNLQQESGIDPTCVETVYSDPYGSMGPDLAKAKLLDWTDSSRPGDLPSAAMDGYWDTLVSMYARQGISLSYDGYRCDGHIYVGIGLVQWTGPTAKELCDLAHSLGTKTGESRSWMWYDLEVQMACLLTKQPQRIQGFINDTPNAGSVASATASWLGRLERGTDHAISGSFQYDQRLAYAQGWYSKLAPQSEAIAQQYSDFAQTTIALANVKTGAATGSHVQKLTEDCLTPEDEPVKAENGTLAEAAVAYAWETKDMGRGNDGTALYRGVHDAMFPGDPWYQSCDRGVATAVAWSGADDSFPPGDTSIQDEYFASHPDKWQLVGSYDEKAADVMPGDILITTAGRRVSYNVGHIVMYTGNDIIKEKYPNQTTFEFVSASFESRSPGCGDTKDSYKGDGYNVYRYTGSYDGSKKNAYTGSESGTSA